MENNICVYRHIRLDTNKVFYIGIGVDYRPYVKYDRNKYWHNIINKTEYEVQILISNITWKEACIIEKKLIKFYGRKNLNEGPLCNMTDGGDGILGYKHREDSIDKIRKATKERMSGEYKLKMYNVHKGSKRSDETKLKMSLAQLGKRVKEETKEKLRIINTGKKHSEETKLKVALNNPRRKQIINIETNIIYNSMAEAAREEKVSLSSLIHYMRGSRKNITNLRKYNDNNKEY